MSDYDLYYWSVPFRGQFVRAVLAFADKTWTEVGPAQIATLMARPVADMPVPFMGPPVLIDREADVAISQMPAIIFYLGDTLDLLPTSPPLRALALKIACDANDVIDDLTLDGGRLMWTRQRWNDFIPRLKKWLALWDEIGRRHGLSEGAGFLLGGESLTVADIVTAVLWSTMADRFEGLAAILNETAPLTSALTRRITCLPPLAALAAKAREDWGEAYCGGQIEASLREVLGA